MTGRLRGRYGLAGDAEARFVALGAALRRSLLVGLRRAFTTSIAVNSAASRVEEAKALGAEQLAPYEYYYAKEHLQQAQVEAAEASYSDAVNSRRRGRGVREEGDRAHAEGAARAAMTRARSDRVRVRRWRSLAFADAACSQGPALRGRDSRASRRPSTDAEKNGAMTCAPRELAMAKSHLEFATIELDQGQFSSARSAPRDGRAERARGVRDEPRGPVRGARVRRGRSPKPGDTDGDGIPDSRDQCVLEPEDKDGYLDDDGCPDLDNDVDGIPDASDKCPNEPEDLDGFEDDDGCPDPDNDGDGVPDVDDYCPNTPGIAGGDKPGCPRKNRSSS